MYFTTAKQRNENVNNIRSYHILGFSFDHFSTIRKRDPSGGKTIPGCSFEPKKSLLTLLSFVFSTCLGLLVSGPLAHTLFELVTKRFIGKEGAKWKIAQILSTQLITSPIQNASKSLSLFSGGIFVSREDCVSLIGGFFEPGITVFVPTHLFLFYINNSLAYILAMALFAGARTTGQIQAAFKSGYLNMMKTSWMISPLSMAIAQKFLPPNVWVPFFNLVAFVFGTYVNTTIKKARIAQIKKEQQRLRDEKQARDEL